MLAPLVRSNHGLPIKYFLTPELMPDRETIAQLEGLAQASGLQHHVAVLPDIHRKSRNPSPTGTAVAARDAIIPRAVDTGICCGMRIIRTEIETRHLSAAVLDALFGELMRTIPVAEHHEDVLSEEDFTEILVHGGRWSQKKFALSDEELNCIEERATYRADTNDSTAILAAMPAPALKKGRRRFGTLGAGNHFLELQEIVEVFDPKMADRLGLARGQAVFMLHTGSRSVGSKMMKFYLEELGQKFGGPPIWSVPANSDEGLRYQRAIAAVSNYGFANRIVITEKLRAAVRKVLVDESLALPLLYDCAHVSIKQELWRGEKLWVHRHGGSRALPPSQMADHPLFSQTGQPVPIPGSMGDDSFIGVADEPVVETFYSLNHGAGRIFDKPEARQHFSAAQIEKTMRTKNIRLYRYGSDNIAEQAPGSFKNIAKIIDAMTALSLAKPVVRTRPLAVLKG